MRYAVFNLLCSTAVLMAAGFLLRSWREWWRVLRVSALMMLLALPWDFVGIKLGVWTHSGPGPTLASVPLNDLWLMGWMTVFTSSALLRFCPELTRSVRAETESKHRDHETPKSD